MTDADLRAQLESLTLEELAKLEWRTRWLSLARPKQVVTFNDPRYNTIMLHPGRGWGKTRVGANWICWELCELPGSFGHVVGATHSDVRYTIIEGESGILREVPPCLIKDYNSSDLVIEFYNGSILRGFSAEKPSRLRGPQCFPADTLVSMADGTRKEISSVIVGDLVQTRVGPKPVMAAWKSQKDAELWQLSTASGVSIRGTMNHPVYVDGKGFVPLCQIQPTDRVCVLSSSVGASIDSSRMGTICGARGLGPERITSESVATCIGTFTNTTMDASRKGMTFTTGTTTSRTTTLQIWWRSLKETIARTMDTITNLAKHPASALAKLCGSIGITKSPRNEPASSVAKDSLLVEVGGFVQPGVSICIGTGASFQKRVSAKSAVLATSPHARSAASAHENAGIGTLHEKRLPHVSSTARAAEPHSNLGAVMRGIVLDSALAPETHLEEVVYVERLAARADVYDLTVECAHEFFANSILVHNCQFLWKDELAAWLRMRETHEQADFGHRLGKRSLQLITTTPQPKELIRELFADASVLKIGGHWSENEGNLSPSFKDKMRRLEGTRLGRQELSGELLDAEELGVVKRTQWRVWPHDKPLPVFEIIIMSLDTAMSEDEIDVKNQKTDFTACTVWGGWRERKTRADGSIDYESKPEPRIILLDAWQERLGFPDLLAAVKRDKDKHYGASELAQAVRPLHGVIPAPFVGRKPDIILIEDKNSGISLRQTLRRDGIAVVPYNPGNQDKYQRLNLVAPLFVSGFVHAVASAVRPGEFRSWAEPVIAQMCSYSGEGSLEHDDAMDSGCQALQWLDRNWLRNEPPTYKRQAPQRTPPGANPYAS